MLISYEMKYIRDGMEYKINKRVDSAGFIRAILTPTPPQTEIPIYDERESRPSTKGGGATKGDFLCLNESKVIVNGLGGGLAKFGLLNPRILSGGVPKPADLVRCRLPDGTTSDNPFDKVLGLVPITCVNFRRWV